MTTGQTFLQGETDKKKNKPKATGTEGRGSADTSLPGRQLVSSSGLTPIHFTTPILADRHRTTWSGLQHWAHRPSSWHPRALLVIPLGRKLWALWLHDLQSQHQKETHYWTTTWTETGKETSHLMERQGFPHVKAQQFSCVRATKQPSAPALPARQLPPLTCVIPAVQPAAAGAWGRLFGPCFSKG